MKAKIYSEVKEKGVHSFYLVMEKERYFLFHQAYRKGVQEYFNKGVYLEQATDFTRSKQDLAIIRTMYKIPMYIKYVEKEYGIEVLEQTKKKNAAARKKYCCA